VPGPFTTPVAISTPFEPNRNPIWNGVAGPSGITSQDVQGAIEEVKTFAENTSRFMVSPGFDGNATVGRYLEFSSNVDSNIAGFVTPRAAVIKELSLVVAANSTMTVQLRKWDGVTETVLTSISLAAARKSSVTGLSVSLAANDEIRAYVSAGSATRPIMNIFCVFT
jgi:hypothetical protein